MNATITITALYDRTEDAQSALRDLQKMDISRNDISLIASDVAGEHSRINGHNLSTESDAAEGAVAGATFGGIGGLVVGLAALAIPGIGPVLAAGPLASALVAAGIGAGVGAVTGGIVGALTEMGVSEETAGYYAEGIRRGATLLTVHVPENMSNQVIDMLNRHNAIDVEDRVSQWRETGWQTHDSNAAPYGVAEIESERSLYTSERMRV